MEYKHSFGDLHMSVPKTLADSIVDGLLNAKSQESISTKDLAVLRVLAQEIAPHVQNFLAHQFTPDLMESEEVRALWIKIKGEKR